MHVYKPIFKSQQIEKNGTNNFDNLAATGGLKKMPKLFCCLKQISKCDTTCSPAVIINQGYLFFKGFKKHSF